MIIINLAKLSLKYASKHQKQLILFGISVVLLTLLISLVSIWSDNVAQKVKLSLINNISSDYTISSKNSQPFDLILDVKGVVPLKSSTDLVSTLKGFSFVDSYCLSSIRNVKLTGSFENEDFSIDSVLTSIETADFFNMFPNVNLLEGKFLDPALPEIMLMPELAKKLDVKTGDEIYIKAYTFLGIRGVKVKVAGIFSFTGLSILLNNYSFINFSSYKELFLIKEPDFIHFKTAGKKVPDQNEIITELEAKMPGVTVLSSLESSPLFNNIKGLFFFLNGILRAISYIIYIIILSNILFYLFYFRLKEISVMNIIGISRRQITVLILFEILFFVFCFTLTGLFLSFLVSLFFAVKGLPALNDYLSFAYGGSFLYTRWSNMTALLILFLNLGFSVFIGLGIAGYLFSLIKKNVLIEGSDN